MLAITGLNYRTSPISVRQRLWIPEPELFEVLLAFCVPRGLKKPSCSPPVTYGVRFVIERRSRGRQLSVAFSYPRLRPEALRLVPPSTGEWMMLRLLISSSQQGWIQS